MTIRKLLRFLLRPDFENILRIDSKSKPKVYLQIFDGADATSINYWLDLFLSTGIATLGLILDSPAVVIGAMLISPLMGPIIGTGLSLATADLYLFVRSTVQMLLSILGVVLFAAFVVWMLPFDGATDEIVARTRPNLLDLGVALFSGLAGALVLARSHSPKAGGIGALPGVAVAVALLPPLCAVGFGVGVGFDLAITRGAALLFITNLVAIIASCFLMFFVIRMDTPAIRAATVPAILERAENDPIFTFVERKVELLRIFSEAGKLRWRILVVLILLAGVAVPLSEALMEVTREIRGREAVNAAVRDLQLSRDEIISRQTTIGRGDDPIDLRMIVTAEVPPEKVEAAERLILRRTGREAKVRIRRVADDAEVRKLTRRQQLQTESAIDFESLRSDLTDRVRRPLTELWPHTSAFLREFEVSFGPEAATVRVQYESDEELDDTAAAILLGGLRRLLAAPELQLDLVRDAAATFLAPEEGETTDSPASSTPTAPAPKPPAQGRTE